MADFEDEFEKIKSVNDISKSIERCDGGYSLLIGAGTSVAAGIKTGNELVEIWKEEAYNEADPDLDKNEWVNKREKKSPDFQSEYGLWFEENYTTREERRRFIKQLVEESNSTFEHIVISSLMTKGLVPITLTPNFDNLVYDAFYRYLEERPLMIDHNALAPQFRITSDDPMIVKLHGDYLYDNLKNTDDETNTLEDNIRDVLFTTLKEYGLIVVGYSGRDESIMNVLNSKEISIPDRGLYWCTTDVENISEETEKLLQKDNTFLVEIDSSAEFFLNLYGNLSELSVPTPVDLRERAEERTEKLEDGIVNVGGVDVLGLAKEYNRRDEYENAIDLLNKSIERNDKSNSEIIRLRAWTHRKMGDIQKALDDYGSVIDLIDEKISNTSDDNRIEDLTQRKYSMENNMGITLSRAGRYDEAEEYFESLMSKSEKLTYRLNKAEVMILSGDIDDGIDLVYSILEDADENRTKSNCLILIIIGKILKGQDIEDDKKELEELFESEFIGTWDFEEVELYLQESDISQDKKELIEGIIELYDENSKSNLSLEDFEDYGNELNHGYVSKNSWV